MYMRFMTSVTIDGTTIATIRDVQDKTCSVEGLLQAWPARSDIEQQQKPGTKAAKCCMEQVCLSIGSETLM